MRALWKGTLSFGLINIPVNVYSASESAGEISFDMLHKKDLSPIRYARICKKEEVEVPYKDIVKGYLNENGEYVVVEEEDFKRAAVQKSKSIDIVDFVDEQEIDPIFYEKPYFLEPAKGSEKAYVLLREALKKSKNVAIARFVFHNREHMAVIKPHLNVLLLNQIRYLSELRKPTDLHIPADVPTSPKEINMALKLIEQLTGHFNPKQYHDTYIESLRQTIEESKGKRRRAIKDKEPKPSKVTDIMHLLEESLATHKKTPKSSRSKKNNYPTAYGELPPRHVKQKVRAR